MQGPGSFEVIASQVIIEGTVGQLLVYSGPAATGNLIDSIAGQAGTDSFSNPYYQGIASYGYVSFTKSTIVPVQQAPPVVVSGTSVTCTFAKPTTKGNTLIAFVVFGANTLNGNFTGIKLGTLTDNWTTIMQSGTNNSGVACEVMTYDPNCAGGQTQVTATFDGGTGGGSGIWLMVIEWPGTLTLDQQCPGNNITSLVGAWTTQASPATTQAFELAMGSVFGAANST